MDNDTTVQRYHSLVSQRKTQDDTMQQIERFVVPFRGEFFRDMGSEHEVNWRRRFIYDSTAIQACQTLAASIQGSLTSAAIKWFVLRFQDEELNEDHESKLWLQDTENRVYSALQESNFDMESSEFYLDLCSFGTGILTEEEIVDASGSYKGIDFSSAPIRDCYFEHDANGNVMRFYRLFQWTVLQIFDKFGVDGMPKELADKLDGEDDVDEKHNIIFVIHNRIGKENVDTTKMLAPLERPFGFRWLMEKDAELLGEEGGYYEMPSFAARWRKVNGSRWGHSPATIALSDIVTLNELVEASLEAIGKVVDPATITTERGLLSDLDLSRGGLTVVRSLDDIKPFESRARFDVADMRIDRLQESINKAFFVDQLELKQSPAMTATEVQVRYELIQRLLGPTLGRLEADYLDPLIKRTFHILHRNKQLAEMPALVKEKEGQYEIEYTGPLPRAQKQEVATSVLNWLGVVGQLAETFPTMMDNVDEDEVVIGLADMSSVPAKFRRDPAQVKKIRDKRQEEMETMKAAEAAQAVGAGMEAVGKGTAALPGGLEGSGTRQ
jgi:hypothetical protein